MFYIKEYSQSLPCLWSKCGAAWHIFAPAAPHPPGSPLLLNHPSPACADTGVKKFRRTTRDFSISYRNVTSWIKNSSDAAPHAEDPSVAIMCFRTHLTLKSASMQQWKTPGVILFEEAKERWTEWEEENVKNAIKPLREWNTCGCGANVNGSRGMEHACTNRHVGLQ